MAREYRYESQFRAESSREPRSKSSYLSGFVCVFTQAAVRLESSGCSP
jgi:hypothetical protein